jgi:hypothetical protein
MKVGLALTEEVAIVMSPESENHPRANPGIRRKPTSSRKEAPMFTFEINYLSSTETEVSATKVHLSDYAGRCLAAGEMFRPPSLGCFTLEDAVRKHNALRVNKAPRTADEVRRILENTGYRFYDTMAEADAAAQLVMARCREVLTKVYGSQAGED